MCGSRQAPRGTKLIRRAVCRVWASGVARTSSSGRASRWWQTLPGCTIDSAQGEEAVVMQVDITFVAVSISSNCARTRSGCHDGR